MKKHLLLSTLFMLLGCAYTLGQDINVLFLGNSFTYSYDIPGMFEQLATEAGVSVNVQSYADPGIALGDWTGNTGHNGLQGSLNMINSTDWDYVIIQDNLGIWVGNAPYQEGYDDVVENRNNILNNFACSEIIYFAGWCPVGGVQTGDSEIACSQRIYNNFIDINSNGGLNEIVSPVSLSWIDAMSTNPGINLYYTDNVHPSVNGAYLTASTLLISVLKIDPRPLSWYPIGWYDGSSVSSYNADIMKDVAWSVTTNSSTMTESNLTAHTPSINFDGTILSTSGFVSYQWYVDEVMISGENGATMTPTVNGDYHVVGFDQEGCAYRSFKQNVNNVNVKVVSENHTVSLSNGVLSLNFNQPIEGVKIYDLLGKEILSLSNIHAPTSSIVIPEYSPMVLIATISTGNGVITRKLVNL